MAFLDTTMAKAAFKKLFGRAHTGNSKELGNESIPSSVVISYQDVFGQYIDSTPSVAIAANVALACTSTNHFNLVLDPSSSGKAYFVTVPSDIGHPIKSIINPTTKAYYATGDRVQRIISSQYGIDYRAILKNNGTEVPPLDSSNWFLDVYAGTLCSETSLGLTNGTLECYVYVGLMLKEVIDDLQTSSGGGSGSEWVTLQFAYNNGQTIDLDGYTNLSIHSETDPYGLDVNVQGAISLDSHLDGTFHSDGYLNLDADKTLRLSDEFNTNTRFSDPSETYGQVLLTSNKSIIGAINQAFLASGGGAGGVERAVYVLGSGIASATGLLLSSPTQGSVELVLPEGDGFTFSQNVFVYLNGQLQTNDTAAYSGSVTNDVALSSNGLRLHFAFDLVAGDTVQVYNTADQVV
jgi:hypothetical protein